MNDLRLTTGLRGEGAVFSCPQSPYLVVVPALVVSLGPRELTLFPAWPWACVGPAYWEWQASGFGEHKKVPCNRKAVPLLGMLVCHLLYKTGKN